MNSRWQANKIGLINFWYYDEQEFPFVKGRMLLRGSNGSGKSVTMQSVIPLLLDGNMSPERLDPFGSRDRRMSSYLLEEDDGREERTGYLYLEFKRQDSETYLTVGMGIRARKGKSLDKWYFSLTDGRRIGRDFFLYKETGEKVTLSKKELENRIGSGGRVMDRQADYMDHVNRQIFGFDTVEEYKEMVDLLIQLRTPKLSKDFKPTLINDILSDSLQALSDDDLRPMAEAIENMDTMNMNLKSRREARNASEKIGAVFSKYNRKMLYDKADRFEKTRHMLKSAVAEMEVQKRDLELCEKEIFGLEEEHRKIEAKKEAAEKERDSLSRSDAFALKERESQLAQELGEHHRTLTEKQGLLEAKQEQYREVQTQIKSEEDRRYEKKKELEALIGEMQTEADLMAFEEHGFMADELMPDLEKPYGFGPHQEQFKRTRTKIDNGTEILAETDIMERRKDELMKIRDRQIRELDKLQRRVSELESILIQTQNEWKESLYKWNGANSELVLDREILRELSVFADSYEENSDFSSVCQTVMDILMQCRGKIESALTAVENEKENVEMQLSEVRKELKEWEDMKDPQPERPEAVIRNRNRLDELDIPYHEFYKVIEFGDELDEEACDRLEEVLLKMGILDAVVVDERYREQVLQHEEGCEDRYLFSGTVSSGRSLLDVLELNDDVNDLFSNQRLTGILGGIAYDCDGVTAVSADGTYSMGVLTGTVAGGYEAGFIGTKARENRRASKIRECEDRIGELEEQLGRLTSERDVLTGRKETLKKEYERLPKDTDMREALRMLTAGEHEYDRKKQGCDELDVQLREIADMLREKKFEVMKIAESLHLTCSYEIFRAAKKAAEDYGNHLVEVKAVHEMFLRSLDYLKERQLRLEDLDDDMENIRYDISIIEKNIRRKTEEQRSVKQQLSLTDYEEIKERLDSCIAWLRSYPDMLTECVTGIAHKTNEKQRLEDGITETGHRIEEYENKTAYFSECYEMERKLAYVDIPDDIQDDAAHIRNHLETYVSALDRESIIRDLNKVFYENRGALTDYQLMQHELFGDTEKEGAHEGYSAKRIDISARYNGTKISFTSLLGHLEEDIRELEGLIKDEDRKLFENILVNTVSGKIRGRINASGMWVQKMNELMSSMDTSSGLKLSLRWRSRTAEQEDQLDTRELVELLKKDYRVMSEDEAARLSAHFRSKVEDARRDSRDSGGMLSFYQIMKETLDYRKWFEFQLFSQKNGERQKELTNSVFGTFSGGEKAMAMYVPLFSAVVAKYQGGRDDAPRLISLDEAFAGVDNRNIRDMFRLMTEFRFDFIINSQVLWGDCDTLDALAIYQLIRPENAKFVTVMPYLWNGHRKELLENEQQAEQRGAELE